MHLVMIRAGGSPRVSDFSDVGSLGHRIDRQITKLMSNTNPLPLFSTLSPFPSPFTSPPFPCCLATPSNRLPGPVTIRKQASAVRLYGLRTSDVLSYRTVYSCSFDTRVWWYRDAVFDVLVSLSVLKLRVLVLGREVLSVRCWLIMRKYVPSKYAADGISRFGIINRFLQACFLKC